MIIKRRDDDRTGYKEPNSETNMRVMGASTSYKDFYEIGAQLPSQVCRRAQSEQSFECLLVSNANTIPGMPQTKVKPSQKFRPKLQPYSPTAICNRLPVVFANEVGLRT
jgi:hypothetical protein